MRLRGVFLGFLIVGEGGWLQFLLILFKCYFFFFSSRRRHTRLVSDWSSDVCSSRSIGFLQSCMQTKFWYSITAESSSAERTMNCSHRMENMRGCAGKVCSRRRHCARQICRRKSLQIGRASCRERV